MQAMNIRQPGNYPESNVKENIKKSLLSKHFRNFILHRNCS